MSYKIILGSEVATEYSVEAGVCDNKKNFDHHGEFFGYPAPCANKDIKMADPFGEITITHLDADTYVGLLRLRGMKLPEGLDFSLMQYIDLNGSTNVPLCDTLAYMVGIGALSRKVKMPRCTKESQDVTSYVEDIDRFSKERIIDLGMDAILKAEKSYRDCRVAETPKVILFAVGADDALDPSRPYEDDYEIVVVYRSHFQAISIYCANDSAHEFAGKTIAGIEFAGHPKACGSPRGAAMTLEDAKRVYRSLSD